MAHLMLDTMIASVEGAAAPIEPDEIESIFLGVQLQVYGHWMVDHDGRLVIEAHP